MNLTNEPTPAEMVAGSFEAHRAANRLAPALLDTPARAARTAIRLMIGVDAARAAGLWRPGIAPIELNWLAESFIADMLALTEISRKREGIPEWTQERLTPDEIAALQAEAWDQPFTTLETLQQAIMRAQMERRTGAN